jgi:hypothetical protein
VPARITASQSKPRSLQRNTFSIVITSFVKI